VDGLALADWFIIQAVQSLVARPIVRQVRAVILLDGAEYFSETRALVGYAGVTHGDQD
jgi:hypothetical protein